MDADRGVGGGRNLRDFDTLDQMAALAKSMEGKRLMYRDLIGVRRFADPDLLRTWEAKAL